MCQHFWGFAGRPRISKCYKCGEKRAFRACLAKSFHTLILRNALSNVVYLFSCLFARAYCLTWRLTLQIQSMISNPQNQGCMCLFIHGFIKVITLHIPLQFTKFLWVIWVSKMLKTLALCLVGILFLLSEILV